MTHKIKDSYQNTFVRKDIVTFEETVRANEVFEIFFQESQIIPLELECELSGRWNEYVHQFRK